MFFNKEKICIKTDKAKDGFKYYVDYGKLPDKKEFTIKLINSIFQNVLVLAVIDTSLMYSSSGINNEELAYRLKELCDKYSIENKVIKAKKENKGIFGIKIKIGDKEKVYDYIFGLILDRNSIERLSDIINKYNVSFFPGENKDILEDFDLDYQDREFDLNIFIDNFMNRLVVNSKGHTHIRSILEKLREEFK